MVVANAVAALSEINDSSPTGTGIDFMLGLFGIFLSFLQSTVRRVSVAELVMYRHPQELRDESRRKKISITTGK
jgi:hypothetical protein